MGGISNNNALIVSAFRVALRHQTLVVVGLLLVVVVAWTVARILQIRAVAQSNAPGGAVVLRSDAEPSGRWAVRVAFGVLWILDGVLQAQGAMPVALPSAVVQPAAASSPSWVQHLVNVGVTVWSDHPIEAAVATVWIQVGIGAWLLLAPRGQWSRLGGLVSVGWGLVVWVFGEAFGGVFGSGLSFLFGAPGAVLIYVVAGLLVALPRSAWNGERLGRLMMRGVGVFFVGMALLEAWPGRGFWQGSVGGQPVGGVTAMVTQMAQTQQPSFVAKTVGDFARFSGQHGFAVNLLVVVALAAIGGGLIARARIVNRLAVAAAVVFCLAVWVLIQDLGFFGGVGTDPNSMIPIAALVVTGYLAVVRPAHAAAAESRVMAPEPSGRLMSLPPVYLTRTLGAVFAVLVTLLGAAPMAVASVRPAAPIVTEALNGQPGPEDTPAAPFSLESQNGRAVSLSGLSGKVVVLTFLDPVCVSDCPLIAQELVQTDRMLGAASRHVELVAVAANPVDYAPGFLRAFDREEDMSRVGNWQYLTGSLPTLRHVWNSYGVQVANSAGGAMVGHSDVAYVIDRSGRTRWVFGADPGSGSSSLKSSFEGLLASKVHQVLQDK